jgi:hypothetical protein
MPIEPPRRVTDGETYARRQHQFYDNAYPNPQRKPSLFKSGKTGDTSTPMTSGTPVRFSVDARLPNPAILSCGKEVPLRVLFKQLSARSEPLVLQTLQVELIGHTKVRAQEVVWSEPTSWVLTSRSNLNQPIGSPSDPADTETELSKEFWYGFPLPDTVAPSFITCNVSRFYKLAVSLGLAYGGDGTKAGKVTLISRPFGVQIAELTPLGSIQCPYSQP